MTENAGVVKPILEWCKRLHQAGVAIKAIKFHGNQYVEVGTPDLDIVCEGVSFKLEAKVPGANPTKIQERRLEEWSAAGSITGVVRSLDDARRIIEGAIGRRLPRV